MAVIRQYFASAAALFAVLTLADAHGNETVAEPSAAATETWLDTDYPYLVVDQALRDTLLEFGRNLDIQIEVSSAVNGRVHHYEHAGPSGDFLNDLAAEHAFDWVFDQGRLFISSSAEKVTRSWPAGSDNFEITRAALSEAAIDDPRYPIGFDGGRGELILSGPPRYVALAAPIIDRTLAPKAKQATQAVNVIHGRARAGGS